MWGKLAADIPLGGSEPHGQTPAGTAGGVTAAPAALTPVSLSCSKRAPRRDIIQGHQVGLGAANCRKGESLGDLPHVPRGRVGQGQAGGALREPPASSTAPSGLSAGALPQDKHALLDITPLAVERLNYVQYYPVVVFCEPESRQGIKAMRQWLAPESRKSSRRLYAQATKMKKYCSHLFTATISLSGSGNAWYEQIKEIIRTQQSQPVWTAAEQVRGRGSLGARLSLAGGQVGNGARVLWGCVHPLHAQGPRSPSSPPHRWTLLWRTAWTC